MLLEVWMNKALFVFVALLVVFISFKSEAGNYARTPGRNAYPPFMTHHSPYYHPGHHWVGRHYTYWYNRVCHGTVWYQVNVNEQRCSPGYWAYDHRGWRFWVSGNCWMVTVPRWYYVYQAYAC